MTLEANPTRFLGHWLVCLDTGVILFATHLIQRADNSEPMFQGYAFDGSAGHLTRFAVVEKQAALVLTCVFGKKGT